MKPKREELEIFIKNHFLMHHYAQVERAIKGCVEKWPDMFDPDEPDAVEAWGEADDRYIDWCNNNFGDVACTVFAEAMLKAGRKLQARIAELEAKREESPELVRAREKWDEIVDYSSFHGLTIDQVYTVAVDLIAELEKAQR